MLSSSAARSGRPSAESTRPTARRPIGPDVVLDHLEKCPRPSGRCRFGELAVHHRATKHQLHLPGVTPP